jgi:hypothetical protein
LAFSISASIGGTPKAADVLTITVTDAALPSGKQLITYVVKSGDTLAKIAAGLAADATANTHLTAAKITATVPTGTSNVLLESQSPSVIHTTYSKSVGSGGTETITLTSTYYGSDSTLFNHELAQDWTNFNALSPCGTESNPESGIFSQRQDAKGNYFCDGSDGQLDGLNTTEPTAEMPYSKYANNQAVLSDTTYSYGDIFASNHEIFAEEFAVLVSKTDAYFSEGPDINQNNPQSRDYYINNNTSFECTLAVISNMASGGVLPTTEQWPNSCPLN